MTQPIDDLCRFGLKLFVAQGGLDGRTCIPIFHRWIQATALNRLLIDVADYSHLQDGPSVLVVGHEGNVAVDTADGRTGLLCTRKQPSEGPLSDRLLEVTQTLLSACRLLEQDPAFGGALEFRTDELEFVSNDRLLAAPGNESVMALTPPLQSLMSRLHPGQACEIETVDSAKDRLTMKLTTTARASLSDLFDRIS